MIKNTTFRILYQTIYVVLGFLGVIGSVGYFENSFSGEFYVYYTNLSNYICLGIMVACLVQTIKINRKKQDELCTVLPLFKFLCVIMILVTFLVYNILLSSGKTASEYFSSPSNLLMHLILPLMFIADWIMFYEHGKVRWFYPLLSTIMPLVYVILILIRAGIIGAANISVKILYPYFFLNVDNLGWGGFFAWIGILVAIFIFIGYIFYFFDNFKLFKQKFKRLNKKDK